MKKFKHIVLQKNRGWRGLAELKVITDDDKTYSYIFSFSQLVWEDMLHGYIVFPHENYYYIFTFDNTDRLPRENQQRSVLIKNFNSKITEIFEIPKNKWANTHGINYSLLYHHIKNNNNHTQSEWNNIGVRVIPDI